MNGKGSAVVILTVVVAVLVGVIGILLFERGHVSADTQPRASTPVAEPLPPAKASTTGPRPPKKYSVSLDLSSEFARGYKTLLIQALRKPSNFNEHYVVTEIGCGAACFSYAVIDKSSGKAYLVPTSNDLGNYSGDPSGDAGESYSLHSNLIRVITENGSKEITYAFQGEEFVLVSSRPIGAGTGT